MISRLLKPSAILLILTFSCLQNLYAFSATLLGGSASGGSPAISCPINPAFNAPSYSQLPLEKARVTTPVYTNKGTSLGLDPRISTLIGAPISGAIGAGLTGGANVGQNIINAINSGLTQGVVKYGIDFIGTQNPILGSLLSGAVAKNIALAIGRDGLFNGIFNIFGNTVSNLFNMVGGVARNVGEGITTFGDALANQGPIGALESFFGSIFGAAATQPVYEAGGVDEFLQGSPSYSYTMPSGEQVNEYLLTGDDSIFFGSDGSFAGLKRDDVYEFGLFELSDNDLLRLWRGDIVADLGEGLELYAQVERGQLFHFEVRNDDGVLLEADPEQQDKPIYIEAPNHQDPNSSFNFWGAVFNLVPMAISFFIKDGVANAAEVGVSGSIDTIRNIHYIFGNGFNNEVVPEGTRDGLIQPLINLLAFKDRVISFIQTVNIPMYETTNLIGNALNWISNFYTQAFPNETIKNFIDAMNQPGDFFENLVQGLIPQSDVPSEFHDWTEKLQTWYHSLIDPFTNQLVDEVIRKLSVFGPIQDAIAFSHSGFFAPLLGAIERMDYDVHTVINYEGPYLNPNVYLQSAHLERIINVWGTAPNSVLSGQYDDSFPFPVRHLDKKPVPIGDFGPPFLMDDDRVANFDSARGIANINIKIIGARHNDFSYKEYKTDSNGNELPHTPENELWNRNPYEPERIAREINFKTNVFMRKLYEAAKAEEETPGRLRGFLENTPGVSKDPVTGVWTVDARMLTYPLVYAYI